MEVPEGYEVFDTFALGLHNTYNPEVRTNVVVEYGGRWDSKSFQMMIDQDGGGESTLIMSTGVNYFDIGEGNKVFYTDHNSMEKGLRAAFADLPLFAQYLTASNTGVGYKLKDTKFMIASEWGLSLQVDPDLYEALKGLNSHLAGHE